MAQSAAANRRQLGAEIQRLRKDRKLRAADVAEHLKCSETRISRIETGTGRAKLRDTEILALCDLFGIDDERQVQALRDLASDAATASAWWDGYREVLPSGLEPLLGFETDARSEWAWEPLLIHGLLQTPAYARAILSAWPSNRPVDVDDLVAVRMRRAELLTAEERTPLELWAVLDESLLQRPIGNAEVMREQIHHLIDMSERTNVTLQILPHTKGAHPGLGGPFSILNFEDAAPVVYVDSPAGNLYLDKRHDVRKFTTSFDLLRAQALDPDTSTALLRDVAMEKERP
ncbi:helix-turn-helix domain-containing protein [Streptomyces sp. NPDC057375]|uniref:helix-turn-helix domain-containing protein n=1 Tax=Streptomyces sp. NPDC057375 TaxID=3346109 RepID=UPI0036359F0E